MSFGLGSLDKATSLMSEAFANAQNSMSKSLSKISSGKRFTNASDDLSSYVKATNLDITASSYDSKLLNIKQAHADVNAMISTANNVMDQLKEAKKLFSEGQSDSAKQIIAGIKTQMNANVGSEVGTVLGGTGYADVVAVGGNIVVDQSTTSFASLKNGGVNDLGAATDVTTVQNSITDMQTYIGNITGIEKQISSQEKLAIIMKDNAVALSSSLTEIDEAKELANITDQGIRQNAAVSMMAQANSARSAISYLYR